MGLVLMSQPLVPNINLNFCPIHLRGQTVTKGPFQGPAILPGLFNLIVLQFCVVTMVLCGH